MSIAIANELGGSIYITNGATISNLKDILPYLIKIKKGDIIFIDEIHRVNKKVQESLFTVMEDFRIDLGRGMPSYDFPPFSMIGATTDLGLLIKPFRDRFIIQFILEPYNKQELIKIATISSRKLNLNLTSKAVDSLVTKCRGIPRYVNNYLKFIRDCAFNKYTTVNEEHIDQFLSLLKIDKHGLTLDDRKYIKCLKDFNSPVGLNTIASFTSISKETIQNVIEPFLISKGLVIKTTRGRILNNVKRGTSSKKVF